MIQTICIETYLDGKVVFYNIFEDASADKNNNITSQAQYNEIICLNPTYYLLVALIERLFI